MRAPVVTLLAVALLGIGGAMYALRAVPSGPAGGATGSPAVPVTTAAVEVGTVPVEIPANGTVVAIATVSVRSRIDGQIETVHVTEGARVKAGDVLFTLDTQLGRGVLAQLEANLDRDRTQLAQAQADAERYARLVATGAGARQQADQARSQALALAATVKADEALIDQTRTTLSYAEIRAETGGRLGAIPLKAGNFVRAADGTVLTTITRIEPIEVRFSIPERYIPDLRAARGTGETIVLARAPGETGEPVQGSLVFVDSQVDSSTGTIALKGEFANTDRRLWPGQFVTVRLRLREEPDTISVPVAAVQLGQTDRFVFVIGADGRAARRPVRLLRVAGGRAVVSGELAAGERVAVDGAQLLGDGTRTVERAATRAGGQ